MYRLKARLREKGNPRELRRRGLIPGVVYGSGINRLLEVEKSKLGELLAKVTRSSRITLTLDGEELETFIKEIQYDPLTDEVIHIDLYHPGEGKEIKIGVPLLIKGEERRKKRQAAGILFRARELLEVKGAAERIPEAIELDVSDLDIGETLHVSDLELEGVEVLTPPESTLITIVTPRVEKVVAAEEVEEAEEGAPEAEEAAPEAREGEEAPEG